ncbi:hypothetical protein E4U56_006183 [Claviceps arundinis]|uniref:Retroviral polymerase SH3-like domain-containing protein n=1 Tax=Claviceps arundinis TaxID=1623583 RepID=A0A9P7MLP8_9HYPO|nr:hypothetical protein E4U56_006183 [Claviceps arundinis]
MAPRAKVGRLVGMDGPKCRLYEIWLPDEERIVRARDAKFDEGNFPTLPPSAESTYIAELVDPSFEEEGRRIIDVPTAEVFVSEPKDVPHLPSSRRERGAHPNPDVGETSQVRRYRIDAVLRRPKIRKRVS